VDLTPYAIPVALFVNLTALLLLVARDWRVSTALLAAQYVGVFFLVVMEWPFAMAVTKLIAGWIASAVLGMAVLSIPAAPLIPPASISSEREGHPQPKASGDGLNPLFFIFAATLVGLAIYSQLSRAATIIPGIASGQVWGGLILIGLGLLKQGFADQTLASFIGILTTFSGFEIIFSVIDATPTTAGLVAGVTLGLAFAGAYLLVAPYLREDEADEELGEAG